jgi:hypothetical protein
MYNQEWYKKFYQENKERISLRRKVKYWGERKIFLGFVKKCEMCESDIHLEKRVRRYCKTCAIVRENEFAKRKRIRERKICSDICRWEYKMICQYKNFKERRKNDKQFAIGSLTRNRINEILKSNSIYKNKRSLELVGCSIQELCRHLENQFTDGMSWLNRGLHGWHIDHIRPCKSFNLSDPEQLKSCFYYTNL